MRKVTLGTVCWLLPNLLPLVRLLAKAVFFCPALRFAKGSVQSTVPLQTGFDRLLLCAPRSGSVYVLGSFRCSSSRRSLRCCLAALRSLLTSCLLAFFFGVSFVMPKVSHRFRTDCEPCGFQTAPLPNFPSHLDAGR